MMQTETVGGSKGRKASARLPRKTAAKEKKIITKDLKVDSKGRVNLSSLISKHVTKVKATVGKDDNITLVPYVEVPESEWWFLKHPEIWESIQRGMKDAAEGRVKELDLSKYKHIIDSEDD